MDFSIFISIYIDIYVLILFISSYDCSFSTIVFEEIFAISFKPFASNQGAFAQLNPFPKVLSGETIYQWQAVSGTSTAHFDQLSLHWGTWTQRRVEKTKENIEDKIS